MINDFASNLNGLTQIYTIEEGNSFSAFFEFSTWGAREKALKEIGEPADLIQDPRKPFNAAKETICLAYSPNKLYSAQEIGIYSLPDLIMKINKWMGGTESGKKEKIKVTPITTSDLTSDKHTIIDIYWKKLADQLNIEIDIYWKKLADQLNIESVSSWKESVVPVVPNEDNMEVPK